MSQEAIFTPLILNADYSIRILHILQFPFTSKVDFVFFFVFSCANPIRGIININDTIIFFMFLIF